jgi:hypothetical protein
VRPSHENTSAPPTLRSSKPSKYGGEVRPIIGVLPDGFSFPGKTSVWFEANAKPETPGVYVIDLVKNIVYQVCNKDADDVVMALVEMFVFDALIGSMDRHPRNWGVLRTATLPEKYEFAPLYDSAKALL